MPAVGALGGDLRGAAPGPRSNSGFWVSGRPSEEPLTNRDTVSTPAEMNTSPSPARIACMAIRVVCSDDEQYRVMVVPGRKS